MRRRNSWLVAVALLVLAAAAVSIIVASHPCANRVEMDDTLRRSK